MNYWLGRALTLALSAMLASTVQAAETVIASNVHGPEGPLFVDGKLYYVAWSPGSLSVWDGKTSKVPAAIKSSWPPKIAGAASITVGAGLDRTKLVVQISCGG